MLRIAAVATFLAVTGIQALAAPVSDDRVDEVCQTWDDVLDEILDGSTKSLSLASAHDRIAPSQKVDPRLHTALKAGVDGIYGNDEDMIDMIRTGQWIDACADAILYGRH